MRQSELRDSVYALRNRDDPLTDEGSPLSPLSAIYNLVDGFIGFVERLAWVKHTQSRSSSSFRRRHNQRRGHVAETISAGECDP